MVPFKECDNCIATAWCKIFNGEIKPTKTWCTAAFRLNKALEKSNIPPLYINANRYNFVIDSANEDIAKELNYYCDNIVDEVVNGSNFFIFGNKPGTGKTYAACTLLNQFIYKTCLTEKFDFENPLGYFIIYPELMDDLRYRRDEEKTLKILSIVNNVPLLLLDDVGSGTHSDFTMDQTFQIINKRVNNNLSTIITSNLTISKLRNVVGSRVVSRILNNCFGIEIDGADRRKLAVKKVNK